MASIDRPLAPPFSTRFTARPSVAEPCAAPPARDRLRDISALALLAGCLFLVAALATYHPADPPLARGFPQHPQPRNACGLCGAAAAAVLTEWLGLGAWLVAALAAVLDAALLRRRPLADLPVRALGGVLAVVGVCTLAALSLPPWCPRPLSGPGGALGALGRLMAETYLATTGATILAAGLAAVGLFLACDALIVTLGGGCLAAVAAVAAGTQAAWRAVAVRMPRTRGADAAHPGPGGLRLHDADWADAPRAGDDDRNQDDDQDEDAEDAGPTIKVRRREVAPVEADDDSSFEADVDSFDTEASDGADPAGASEEDSAAVPVPIRSRTGRCKPGSVLEMAPDPSADYELPSVDLLLPAEQLQLDAQEQEVRERAKVLEKTFADFGFKVRVVEIETGPVISQYEIELEAGLRLAKIANLADDLAIALRVPSVRIVAPIPGKNSVGIEVPNTDRQMVRLREVIEETQAKSRTMKIPIFLGKDVAGNPMVVDMAAMPHLLIAGRTGTGKSVCLNSLIVSMLMTRRPDEVRMLLIDPKMVELTPYKSLPHLMHPVVTDMKKAEAILAWAVDKMEERYALLAKVGVRHLSQYNALGRETILERMAPESDEEAAAIPTTMPYIVMIADEIADMMMTAGKEIEQHIIRLAQKSRAVGIHLVLATQKPTVDVITGLIKSNLPARIAFQVASRTDSRVVLDEMGAERLLGNGDMLFLSPGTSQILRGQGTYLSDDEIGRVMAAVGTDKPQYAEELVNLQPAPSGDAPQGPSPKDKDELYEAAVEVVIREGRGSVSLLQRALGVGYGRGARLIDFMAEDGVVGQYAGSQAREVLLTMEQWAERNGTEPVPADPAPRGKLRIQPHAKTSRTAVEVLDEEDDEELEAGDEADEDRGQESDEFDADADDDVADDDVDD